MTKAPLLNLRIIAAALFGSTVIYFVVLMLMADQWADEAVDVGVMPVVLGLVSVSIMGMIPVMRKVTMGTLAIGTPPPSRSRDRVSKDALDEALRKANARYLVGTIVGSALAESIAIFGFVLAVLTQDPMAYLPGWFVGGALMLIQFPTQGGLLFLLSDEERATFAEIRGT